MGKKDDFLEPDWCQLYQFYIDFLYFLSLLSGISHKILKFPHKNRYILALSYII